MIKLCQAHSLIKSVLLGDPIYRLVAPTIILDCLNKRRQINKIIPIFALRGPVATKRGRCRTYDINYIYSHKFADATALINKHGHGENLQLLKYDPTHSVSREIFLLEPLRKPDNSHMGHITASQAYLVLKSHGA